jgi:hypothetical protein
MLIERRHNLGKEEAIHKIDTFLEDLMRRQFPGEVAIKDASKSWSNDAMHFSFKATIRPITPLPFLPVTRSNSSHIVADNVRFHLQAGPITESMAITKSQS